MNATTITRPASPRQINYIGVLRKKCGLSFEIPLEAGETVDIDLASKMISALQAEIEVNGEVAAPAKTATPPLPPKVKVAIEDGMYSYNGGIYKVIHAVHGSGFQYAKKLSTYKTTDADGNEVTKAEFVRAYDILRKLRPEHLLTVDEAKKFGALYGICVRCTRTLTREDSIERMMGRTCAAKMGFKLGN